MADLHLFIYQINRPDPRARVVNHDVGFGDLGFHVQEKLRHLLRLRSVNREDAGGGFLREWLERFDIAGGEADSQTDFGQAARERRADAGPTPMIKAQR
jgi:hypothetical protein